MPSVRANGIDIEYESIGNPSDPALILVMGLGAQMLVWPDELCDQLAARGFRVIRFDNRDVGLSTKIEDAPTPDVLAAMGGDASSASYTLDDMADDAAGLLDALDIDKAHIVGASMGGMIAQTIAIRHPQRVLSLCSIMSTVGDRSVGGASEEAIGLLLSPPPNDREGVMDRAVKAHHIFGGKGFPADEAKLRERAGRQFDRAFYPIGVARQLVAVLAHGDRTEKLGQLDVPTVVIHGTDDTLVMPSGGEATAKAIPGADLLIIDGMGHDLPEGAWPQMIDAIADNAAKAAAAR